MLGLYIFIFIVSSLVLVRAGTWVIQALTTIAQFLRWREFIVASVLMTFATSSPELFIGIISAFHQKPQLSFGNVIGANIIVLTLVIGIGAILTKGLRFEGKVLQRSPIYASAIALLPFLLMLDGKVSRIDGVILLLVLVFYFHYLLSQEERFTKILSDSFKKNQVGFKLFLKDFGLFLGGACLLLLSAEGIVFSVSNFATILNLPLVIIGIFLVAIGTTLPEMTFGIRSIAMGHKELILGNVMGAVVVNSTLVLGIVALICPFEIPSFSPYFIGIIFTAAACLFFTVFARTGRKITKKEALILLGIYITFVLAEILIK